MAQLSKAIVMFLVAVVMQCQGDDKNGAAPLYPRMSPGVSLSYRYEIIRNTPFVQNLTSTRHMDRITKLEKLELWMRGYNSTDKYDLIDMYDRMLTIQNRVKFMFTYYFNRMAILKIELLRGTLDKIVGKQNKMNYVMNITFSDMADYYFKPTYFFYDFDWEQDYPQAQWFPAHQVFIDYYFPTHVQSVLNNTKLTIDQKISTINYKKFDNPSFDDEITALKQYYRNYLTSKSNSTTSGK